MAAARDLVVVYGGPSAEHEVSCVSAHLVAHAALRAGSKVTLVGLTHDKCWADMSAALETIAEHDEFPSPDGAVGSGIGTEMAHLGDHLPDGAVIFPLLHGPFGEDGVIQGHLEAIGYPYVGAGVLSSAMCMDKAVAKSVLRDHGLAVGAWRTLRRTEVTDQRLEDATGELGLPLFVKPANLGSSIGVTKVKDVADLRAAVDLGFQFDDFVILEEFLKGRELELALLGNSGRCGSRDWPGSTSSCSVRGRWWSTRSTPCRASRPSPCTPCCGSTAGSRWRR
jgi:D-alanine-D-alanine ligase